MKIAFGCDHGGFVLKAEIIEYLEKNGHEIIDFGINDDHSVDYPDYGLPVAECVSAGEADFGIIACGTGIGISITANKVPGIRCALLSDTQMDYPMGEDIITLIPQVRAKTLSRNFMEQLEAVEALYGQSLKFSYSIKEIEMLLEKEPYYPEEIKIRVRDILLQQRRTYQYLFR